MIEVPLLTETDIEKALMDELLLVMQQCEFLSKEMRELKKKSDQYLSEIHELRTEIYRLRRGE